MKQYLKGLQHLRNSAISFRSSTSATIHVEYHLTLEHFLGKCLKGLCHEMNDFLKVLKISVADPGCLSQIPDLDFYPSRIPDPRSRIPDPKPATKERGEKKMYCHTFLCSHNFHKIENYFIFGILKKIFGQFSKNYRTFYPNICH